MSYDFRHVRYFMAVAEELHFRKAAESLNIAQPALSRTIKQLEEMIGVQLFLRNNRRVDLTEAGKIFLVGCKQIVALMEDTKERARKAALGVMGHLTIRYTDFAISGCLPDIVDAFSRRYPDISLDIQHQFTEQQLQDVCAGQFDFGFMTGPVVKEGIMSVPVQRNNFVVVLPEGHPLVSLKAIPLEMLANEPFVMGSIKWWRHYHQHLNALCNRSNFYPRIVQEAYNTESILGLVAANMGITILLDCIDNYYRKGITVRPIKDVEDVVVTEVAWSVKKETPVKAIFIQFVTDFLHLKNH